MIQKQKKSNHSSIAGRINSILPSATLTISAKAMELRAQGLDIISLSQGEPDFDTPEHIKKGAIQAINRGATKYTAVDGTPELKEAIINKFSRDNNLIYEPENILVSSGAKQTCYNLFQSVLEEGTEAIVVSPYWVSYPDMIILTGGKPIILKTTPQNNFKLTMDDLRLLLNDQTRLLMLNSPSNPTGFAYSENQYQEIGEVLKDFPNVLIASDEIYEHIYWGKEKYYSFAQACPDLFNRTITINGVSKAYAMTGWRIGYCGGPVEIIRAMKKIQGQSTSNASSISQVAAISALNGSLDCVVSMVEEYKNRYHYLFNTLEKINGFKLQESSGAFYAFPEVIGAINRLNLSDDIEFSKYLLEKAQVAVIPGSAFGAPGHIRISFATSMELLEKAMDRIKRVVE